MNTAEDGAVCSSTCSGQQRFEEAAPGSFAGGRKGQTSDA